jgi:hypothetical protein
MSGPTYSDIPNELLDRIVALVLAPSPNDFGAIASLTLVSAQFRQVALRRYLRVLRLREKAQWSRLWSLLGAQQGRYAWVKCASLNLDELNPPEEAYMRLYGHQSSAYTY